MWSRPIEIDYQCLVVAQSSLAFVVNITGLWVDAWIYLS